MATNKFKSNESLNAIDMALNQELLNSLRRLGLNQYEAQAYLTLSTMGQKTAGELSEEAELPRPRVYDVLSKLQGKGFVALQPGRPVRYAALPITEAVRTLKKQKEAALLEEVKEISELEQKIGGKLKNVPLTQKYWIEENVWTLKGREAIYSKLSSMISHAKNHVVVSSPAASLSMKLRAHGKELERAGARGAKIHILSKIDLNELGKLGEVARVASHIQRDLPTRFVLADDEALVFLTGEKTDSEDEVGVWIRSPHLVSTFKQVAGLEKK
jgi:sugar-specific transcriptional regulator TrmB